MATDQATEETFWGPEIVKKRCSYCKELKPLNEFGITRYGRSGRTRRQYECRTCRPIAEKARRQALTPEQRLAKSRRQHLKFTFGMSPARYHALLEAQGGVCAICHKPESILGRDGRPRSLAVDHDHATNRRRQLLCFRCNVLIGMAKDDVPLLRDIIAYLERHREARS